VHILLSNDDGIDAEGLQLLREELLATGEFRITTVAPDREQSATSHALSLAKPLRVERRDGDQYAIGGTPTDCIVVALRGILADDPPDVVVSGINHGPNMGEDVHYSGTVAAAFEGMVLGARGIALSLTSKARPRDFRAARRFVGEVLPAWLRAGIGEQALYNVNIPARSAEEVPGIRLCALGSRSYNDLVVRESDEQGGEQFRITGSTITYVDDADTDFVLNAQGYITVTPLKADLTDHGVLGEKARLEDMWPT